ncbi:hypothetical protein PSD17_66570 [Pseudonocardia sp. D17]|nr:hypothetical protein PSD17_66570 [Pseudonocardia sp. D17]
MNDTFDCCGGHPRVDGPRTYRDEEGTLRCRAARRKAGRDSNRRRRAARREQLATL